MYPSRRLLRSGVPRVFSDSRRSLAQSEVPVSADGIGELGESAVLPRGQERGLVRGQWRGTFVDLAEAALQEAAAVILSVEKTRLADVNRFHTHAARVGVEVQERSTCGPPADMDGIPATQWAHP